MPEEKIAEKTDAFLVDHIISEYKGQKLTFYTLSIKETFKFANLLFVDPQGFLESDKELSEFIGASLRRKPEEISGATPGFKIFALRKVLEAIDFPFLLKNSNSLNKEIEKLTKELGASLPVPSSGLVKPSDTPPPTSSTPSPSSK